MTEKSGKPPTLDELVKIVSNSDIASISTVVQRILQIIRHPNSSALQLKEIIEIDPPLSAKVLRQANSAFYGIGRSVTSIQEAIIYLGFNCIREMAFSLKVSEFFSKGAPTPGYSRKQLWKHSLAVALCAKGIYRGEFREEGDDIYSAALLHDLGIIVEEQMLNAPFLQILAGLQEKGAYSTAAEQAALGYNHMEIGERLLRAWNFPLEFVTTIGAHHNPFAVAKDYLRPAVTLFIADVACEQQQIGHDCFAPNERLRHRRALELLDLTPKAVEIIVTDVRQEIEQMDKDGELFL